MLFVPGDRDRYPDGRTTCMLGARCSLAQVVVCGASSRSYS